MTVLRWQRDDGAPLAVDAVMVDLDGTLLDTIPDLATAANLTLQEIGRPPLSLEVIKSYVGKGIPTLVKRCLTGHLVDGVEPDDEELARVLPIFKRHYAAENGRLTTIYPGVREGLAAMEDLGLPLACVTNKAAAFTEPLLARMGLSRHFRVVVSGDTLAEKKPHPAPLLHICSRLGVAPERALLIGDSVNDVAAARAAGCPVFCVPYGYNEGADVRELDCDAIVPTLDAAARRLMRPAEGGRRVTAA